MKQRPLSSSQVYKSALAGGGVLVLLLGFQNCGVASNSSTISSASQSSVGVNQVQMNLRVIDSSGHTVYNDAVPNSSLTLKAGSDYTFIVGTSATLPSGASLSLAYTNLSVVSQSTQTMAFRFGSNLVKAGVFQQGTYKFQMQATAPGMVNTAKTYNVSYTCANPTFTAASLNASGVSVTGTTNMYSFNVANVVSGANGLGPYQCAVDQTGSSILDTSFQSCSTLFSNLWSNYVSTRTVHVAVRDACNIVQQVSAPVNLAYSEPAMGTEVPFVFGVTAASAGTAIDARVQNLTYLATNQSPNIDVQSSINGSAFTIQASHNYQLSSSVAFGIKISLANLTNSVNIATGSGSISAAGATIQELDYSTDESGDSQVALSFSKQSCVLSNQGAKVMFVAGTPCTSSGKTGDQNKATIEVWGHYKCTNVANTNGSFTIEGDFDGMSDKSDSCVGGGGGGGGGIVPISL